MRLDGAIVDEAGGLAELLSDHADKVMASAAPDERRERIVEAVFRALTDVNAEGSAIRRPLAVQKLCAVTGATPDELRPILDAFRAPGVSFLTPYAPQPIDDKTPIDISHEALIRCWRRISDKAGRLAAEGNPRRAGLATLLFQAETFANDKENFLSEPATELGDETAQGAKRGPGPSDTATDGRRSRLWSRPAESIGKSAPTQRKSKTTEKEEQERRVRDAERIAEEQRKAATAQRRTAHVAIADWSSLCWSP